MQVSTAVINSKRISRIVLLSLIVILMSTMTSAQSIPMDETGGAAESQLVWLSSDQVNVQPVILYHDPNPPMTLRVPPPRVFSMSSIKSATILINYLAAGQVIGSYTCYEWPNEAKAAFNYAASIWESLLNSNVGIEIDACWTEMTGDILGSSSSNWLYNTFTSTYYSESLANSLAGFNIDPGDPDMTILYNRLFGWYYGTDGSTPSDRMDFTSVVLHEIGHGLGFAGSMIKNGNFGYWGWQLVSDPAIYDRFTEIGSGTPLLDLGYGTISLGSALTGGDIYFNGTNANAANGGSPTELYAPSTWQQGSSYSHLDYDTYNDTVNELMVYAISDGESIHSPGPITLGMLEDMGWVISSIIPPPIVTSITPDSGLNDGVVHITNLSGSDFVNSTVKLAKLGQADIPGTSVTVVNTNTITCDFNVFDAAAGEWDVVVTNEDAQQATLTNGFTVIAVPEPDVNISKAVIGSNFKPGDSITFTLDIANTGTLTATNVIVTDEIPPEVINPYVNSTVDITATGAISYTWNAEPLHLGESGRISIYGQIDPGLEEGLSFVNTAIISDTADTTPGNNTSSVSVSIGEQKVYLPLVLSNWPSIQTVQINAEADATLLQGLPSMNLGETADMWVGYHHIGCIDDQWGGEIARSLVNFDLSSIPTGAFVSQATLYLYHANYCDIGQRTHTVTAHRINGSWSELSVTWNNQPSYAEAYGSTAVTSGAWGWFPFDVSGLVQGWVNGSYNNHGVMLRGPESSGNDSAQLGFYTLDDLTDVPYLEITYSGTIQSQPSHSAERVLETTDYCHSIAEVLNPFASSLDYSLTGTTEWVACSFQHEEP